MSSFELNIKNLSNELLEVKDKLELKLESMKLSGLSDENILYVKTLFEQVVEEENKSFNNYLSNDDTLIKEMQKSCKKI